MRAFLIISLFLFSFSAIGQGGPCDTPNPPSWCNNGGGPCESSNPPSWCNNTSVPINDHLWILALLGIIPVWKYAKNHIK